MKEYISGGKHTGRKVMVPDLREFKGLLLFFLREFEVGSDRTGVLNKIWVSTAARISYAIKMLF